MCSYPEFSDEGATFRRTKLAWVLTDPTRVKILRFMMSVDSASRGELVERLEIAEPVLTRHLDVLCEVSLLVGDTGQGTVRYRVDESQINRMKNSASEFSTFLDVFIAKRR
ncbi:MAG: ArsR/SmtB family transcription factor [Rhodopirellula sp. JB044]|uniref:ArsR/SmtB family transcription factor n=1 Tax=Rhodopirellula sp. JB044 TaxID=3342844 RepID=UPI00370BE902